MIICKRDRQKSPPSHGGYFLTSDWLFATPENKPTLSKASAAQHSIKPYPYITDANVVRQELECVFLFVAAPHSENNPTRNLVDTVGPRDKTLPWDEVFHVPFALLLALRVIYFFRDHTSPEELPRFECRRVYEESNLGDDLRENTS